MSTTRRLAAARRPTLNVACRALFGHGAMRHHPVGNTWTEEGLEKPARFGVK